MLSASEVLIPCAGSPSVCVAGVFPALHEALKSMGKGLTELPRQVGAQVRLSDIADMLFEKLRNCGIPHLIQLPHSLKKTAVQDMSTSEGEPPPSPRAFPCVLYMCIYGAHAASHPMSCWASSHWDLSSGKAHEMQQHRGEPGPLLQLSSPRS